MAFTITDQAWLDRLNEVARSKVDKELGFSEIPAQAIVKFVRRHFGSQKPFDNGQGFPYTYKPGGNFLHRPLVDLPKVALGMSWFTMQSPFRPKFHQIMERDFFRCVSRVGLQNTEKYCKIYWEDLVECQTHERSVKRAALMRKVRNQKNVAPMSDIAYTAFPEVNT